MDRKATTKPTTTTATTTAEQQMFMATLMNLSWQLLIVVVLPFVGGHYLDVRLKTTPLWTLVGFGIALALASLATYRAYRSLTGRQAKLRGDKHV